MVVRFPVPDVIAKARLAAFPLDHRWSDDHTPWITDGARTPIVKKLAAMSLRAGLALLLVSGEWLIQRLGAGPACDAQLAIAWREALHPGTLDRDTLTVTPVGKPKLDGPIQTYLNSVRDCLRIARDFDGALFSYVESALKLVDHVMPSPAYRTWRRHSYDRLAALSGAHTMIALRGAMLATANQRQIEDYEVEAEIVARDGHGALWGPVVLRDEVLADAPILAADRAERLAAFERLIDAIAAPAAAAVGATSRG